MPVFLLALLVVSTTGAQEGDFAEVQPLNSQVFQHHAAGQYQQAIHLHSALAITEAALWPEHPATAPSLNNLASLCYETGAYTKASLSSSVRSRGTKGNVRKPRNQHPYYWAAFVPSAIGHLWWAKR